jgi:hypothetical protein
MAMFYFSKEIFAISLFFLRKNYFKNIIYSVLLVSLNPTTDSLYSLFDSITKIMIDLKFAFFIIN